MTDPESPEPDSTDHRITMWVAAISAAAAILGATVGGVVTYATTSAQISAGQKSAERDIRKSAYADFTVAAERCREIVDDIYAARSQPVSLETADRYDKAYNELREKRTVVNLLGSRRLAILASNYSGAITFQFTNSVDITRGDSEAEKKAASLQDDVVDAEFDFYQEAKRDLGLN